MMFSTRKQLSNPTNTSLKFSNFGLYKILLPYYSSVYSITDFISHARKLAN